MLIEGQILKMECLFGHYEALFLPRKEARPVRMSVEECLALSMPKSQMIMVDVSVLTMVRFPNVRKYVIRDYRCMDAF